MSNSLWPHGLQYGRLPCPSLPLWVCSNLCKLSWWCHLTISSSVFSFSYYPLSSPASESFPMSQFFTSGGQRIEASASVLPMNTQGWFSLGLTGLISFLSKGFSSLLQHHNSKASILWHSAFLWSNSHIRTWLLEKTLLWLLWTFVSKVISLLFNMLSRCAIAFLTRSKHLLIAWL